MSSFATKYAAASAVAPAAFTAVVSIASGSLPAGLWRLRCYSFYLGTLGTAELASGGNIELYLAGTTTVSLALGAPPIANALFGPQTFDVQLDGNTTLELGTGGSAGSSGVTYGCILVADQVIEQGVFDL